MIKAVKWLCMLVCMATVTIGFAARNNKKNENKKTVETTQQTDTANEQAEKSTKKTAQAQNDVKEKGADVAQPTDQEQVEGEQSDVQDEPALKEEAPEGVEEEMATEETAVEEPVQDEPMEEDEVGLQEDVQEGPWQEDEAVQEEIVHEEPFDQGAEQQDEQAEPEPEPVQLGPDEIMGIDTVDLEDPQGNWLYKRVWWERAEAKYEKIRTAVNSVLEIRTRYFAKRAELDKTVLDPFYIKIGLSQGELQEIIAELIVKTTAGLQEKTEEDLLEKLEADKKELEELQKDVQEVIKQDEEVENAIMMLVDQANKMRNYEQQAWQDFKNIARVLDDKKARELFYKVDGAWRNIQELQQYVQNNFSTGFDALVEQVSQKVQKVDSAMQALKERGIDLKQRIIASEQAEEPEQEQEEQPQPGVFSRFIILPITNVVSALWDFVMWPIRKLMGTDRVEPEEEVVEEDVQEVQETQEMQEPQLDEQSIPSSITPPPDIPSPMPFEEVQEQMVVEEPSASAAQEEDAVADQKELAGEIDMQKDDTPFEEQEEITEESVPAEGGEDVMDIGEFDEPMMDELDMSMEEAGQE